MMFALDLDHSKPRHYFIAILVSGQFIHVSKSLHERKAAKELNAYYAEYNQIRAQRDQVTRKDLLFV